MNILPLRQSPAAICRFLIFFCFLIFLSAVLAHSQNLNLDRNFTAGVSDAAPSVYVSTAQSDGKILVGGSFSLANNRQRPFLARLNENGSLDENFNAGGSGPNAPVYDIIVLADGKILIGGTFTAYNGTAKGGLARLNADGSLDAGFNPNGAGTTGTVQTIAVQPDGKILIAGSNLSSYNGAAKYSVIRINADGSLDASFTSPFTSSQFVEEVDVQSDGKILIGGAFTVGSPTYRNIARLNSNGSLDTAFNPGGTDGGIYALTLLADGKILIGGEFTYYQNLFRPKIARLNADGTLDVNFNPGSLDGASAEYFAVQPDGKILVAGKFLDFFNQQFSIIRLNAGGSLDNAFQPLPANDLGYSVKLQSSGKIIVTGFFTAIGGENRRGIVRLGADGKIDVTFDASFSNYGLIEAIAEQPDGKIIVGGSFELANGTKSFNIARFNRDGTLDTTFNTGSGTGRNVGGAVNIIYDIALQADGKILVGGTFGTFNGADRPGIVRLNTDGSVDTSFAPRFFDRTQSLFIYDIFVQPDGKILLGGFGVDPTQQFLLSLIRLIPNGDVDSMFNSSGSGANGSVRRIVRQPDGKLLIGGVFSAYNGQPRSRIARLSADGALDPTFNLGSGANGTILDMTLQPDGKIVIVGSFTTFNGVSRNRVARLNADGSLDTTFNVGTGADSAINTIEKLPDGKFLIGGFFTSYNGTSVNRLARLNADGSLDNSFASGLVNDPLMSVRRIYAQADGKVLVGGVFSSYQGVPRGSLLRLTPSDRPPTPFDYDGDGKADVSVFRPSNGIWYISGSTNGFSAAQFGQTGDRIVPADYDGDGKTDYAVYRGGDWFLLRSAQGFGFVHFGAANDTPQPADFDGDGKAELAVFRPSSGSWYVLNLSNNQFNTVAFGVSADKPVVGDYDGDGKADYAVYRPADGIWYVLRSSEGFGAVQFGNSSDKPVPADYDGDGRTDFAVYRNGVWFLLKSQAGFAAVQFGLGTDLPAAADYDGDGKTDLAVFRNGVWYLQQSSNGFAAVSFGQSGDLPTQSAFVP